MTWTIGLPVLRVVLVGLTCTSAWLLTRTVDGAVPFPPPSLLACAAMLPVNILCLALIARRLRGTGRRLRDLMDFSARRLGVDVLWGLVWLVVLYLPFTATIMLVVWLQHGADMFAAMETIFFDPAAVPQLPPLAWTVIAVVAVLTFAPLNAPAEELVYRGISQRGLAERVPVWAAIVIPSSLFALQHIWYAPTPDAVSVFVAAFFVWGVVSGIIYRLHGRLIPIIVAHFLVDLVMSLPALMIPFFVFTEGA
ncbi:CPBP family intramembrane glutamic endopeptidase [Microbacterium pseudoresistens]|uniref:CAAX prenyl protease 2/Lysostaphin resistance protein A-like domain-containing protein n=1 Tax=Microbacterium pseudoresistens TaxID=640634 RepID=A0A7Y9ESL5_9MICO|nr:CPBP family intramembrane glutamic endopeptidase [Microbacterium pseudoresistens]NYD53190.1 hypothetical protein [Microbacterium pseudoresistens]